MRFEGLAEQSCTISRSLALLGDRWTLAIVKQAFARTRRFEDFLTTLGISRALLADRLRRLSEAGIFEKIPYDSTRQRYEYRLTEAGFALYPILQAIREWGDTHLAPEGAPLVYAHRGCTGSAMITMTCSTCHAPLSARDIDVQLGPGLTAPASAAHARRSRARHRAPGRRATPA
jgi:DNA-binding HxlR family transcriptional regulator